MNSQGWHHILEFIESAPTLIKIDVIRFDELHENSLLRSEIEKNKIVLFEKKKHHASDLTLVFERTEKALAAFEFAINQQVDPDLVHVDSTIQRFEFTIELFWKLLKKILLFKGIQTQYPRDVLKEAYAGLLIQDESTWLDMLKDRSQTSHTDDQALAIDVYSRMPNYLNVFKKTLYGLKPIVFDKQNS